MCRYCNYESDDNRIFIDPLINEYYLDIETMVCDSYDDGFFMIKNISIIVHGAEENLNMPSFNLQYGLACLYKEMTEKYARSLTDMRD